MDDRLKLTLPKEDIEATAWEQIEAALELPFLKKLAIMPDVHAGYDLPIGGVALLDGYVWPGAVGFDQGCGLCHVNTDTYVDDLKLSLGEIEERLYSFIPVGFNSLDKPIKYDKKFPNKSKFAALHDAVRYKASTQLGTMGQNNHFCEVGVNEDGFIGITIHSGSRKAGYNIGDLYMRLTGGPVKIDSDIGSAFMADMNWALQFALDNRMRIMESMYKAMMLPFNKKNINIINENHNHAVITKDGVLHRKGATPADKDQIGIIPANMHDGVYITRGLGNEEFLSSASHGAGRKMSRGQAKRELDHDKFVNEMDGIRAPTDIKFIAEAKDAYKDINYVLAAQDGILVDIIDHFKPLIVIKG